MEENKNNELKHCSFLNGEAKILEISNGIILEDEILIVLNHNFSEDFENYLNKNIFPIDNVIIDKLTGFDSFKVISRLNTFGVSQSDDFTFIDSISSALFAKNLTDNQFLYNNNSFIFKTSRQIFEYDTKKNINFKELSVHVPKNSRFKFKESLKNLCGDGKLAEVGSSDLDLYRILTGEPKYKYEYAIESGSPPKLVYNAVEAGLMKYLHFRKGCYVGNEAVNRMVNLNSARRKLMNLRAQNISDLKKILEFGIESLILYDDEDEVAGNITSVAHLSSIDQMSEFNKHLPKEQALLGYIRSKHAIAGKRLAVKSVTKEFSPIELIVADSSFSKYSTEYSPAPPVIKEFKNSNGISSQNKTSSSSSSSSSKGSDNLSNSNAEEEKRKAEKLRKMQENLEKFKASMKK